MKWLEFIIICILVLICVLQEIRINHLYKEIEKINTFLRPVVMDFLYRNRGKYKLKNTHEQIYNDVIKWHNS